jgi:hypothetical protein
MGTKNEEKIEIKNKKVFKNELSKQDGKKEKSESKYYSVMWYSKFPKFIKLVAVSITLN